MARTREEVYSLFGIKSPAQIKAERDQAFAAQLRNMSGAGQAGAGLGRLFGSALGFQTDEEKQSAQMTQALQGVNTENPQELRELAATVSSFAPEAAMKMLASAAELEKVTTGTVYKQVQTPVLDDLGSPLKDADGNVVMKTTSIPLTGRFDRSGKFLGFVDTDGDGVDDNTGKTAAETAKDSATDLGDGVSLEINKPEGGPVTAEEREGKSAVTTTVSPEAAERIGMQSGASRTTRTNATGVGVTMPPAIKGEPIYGDPQALLEASNALRDQITQLENSNDKNKDAKIRILEKRRAELAKLRIQSRRNSAPADLSAEGNVGSVFAGFRDVK